MPRWVPRATYRLQLRRGFGLREVRRLLPYLDRLGVDTVYLSPLARAQPGSEHGYDGVDPTRIDPDRGSLAAFRRLSGELRRRRMGLVLDIVPNHLATSLENPWWRSVLAEGRGGPAGHIFDIRWSSEGAGPPKVHLPLLAHPLDEAFRRGEVALVPANGGVRLRVAAQELPVAREWLARATAGAGSRRRGDRHRASPLSPPSLDRLVARINRPRGAADRKARSDFLAAQHYRLIPWRAVRAINYRRFFDIGHLIGVRTEDPAVFRAGHALIAELARGQERFGLRIDHIDGLADPLAYLRRLRRLGEPPGRGPAYVVVEKILGADEGLPPAWPVEGTTGYEAMDWIAGVLVDPRGVPVLERYYRERIAGPESFVDVVYRAKGQAQDALFPADLARFTDVLVQAGRGRGSASAARPWRRALRTLTSTLPVYRTYARDRVRSVADRRHLREAAREAERRAPGTPVRPLARLLSSPPRAAQKEIAARFLRPWQQWTGAVAAKGLEDTALYRDARFLGRNEVGARPDRASLPPEEFHRRMAARVRDWPHALTATATHDTKRGEDARARLLALSHVATEWIATVERWRVELSGARTRVEGRWAPSPRTEYFLLQSLVGAYPFPARPGPEFEARFLRSVEKALREAKEETSWTAPNARYEAAVAGYARALLDRERSPEFARELEEFVGRLASLGERLSLAQLVLKLTTPGVPDLYQGTELPDLSFVDPDNRSPVDFALRRRALARIERSERSGVASGRASLGLAEPGARKMTVLYRLLRLRRKRAALFARGRYVPIGETARVGLPTLAFARVFRRDWVLVAVGRGLPAAGSGEEEVAQNVTWRGRYLGLPRGAPRRWTPVLSPSPVPRWNVDGRELALSQVFRSLPIEVAVGRAGGRT